MTRCEFTPGRTRENDFDDFNVKLTSIITRVLLHFYHEAFEKS